MSNIAGILESDSKEVSITKNIGKNTLEKFIIERLRFKSINELISEVKMIGSTEEMMVEYGFIINGVEGFYRIKSNGDLKEEELYYIANKKSSTIFKVSKESVYLNLQVFKDNLYRDELKTQIEKYWGKHTFLAIISNELSTKNVEYVKQRTGNGLMDVFEFFRTFSVICNNGNRGRRAHLGISNDILAHMENGEINSDKIDDLYTLEKILRDFLSSLYSDIKDVFYLIEQTNSPSRKKYKLFLKKLIGGEIRNIDFSLESTGTQKILEIFPAFFESINGATTMIDEMDSGIHDLLVKEIFDNMYDCIKGQLIITTHNTLLMENAPKEYVYIIKISVDGKKSINCITDYSQRTQQNHNLRERYLKGSYEGIPSTSYIEFDSWSDKLLSCTMKKS